jgi:tellurite methyltransferase
MPRNASIDFFDRQFHRQIEAGEYALNPFESLALPYLRGSVLDLGCGLGNLALAAATRGASVTALDACAQAIDDVARRARARELNIEARIEDLSAWRPERTWDAVACIGLLMFFAPAEAYRSLAALREAVRPGGVVVVNVLVEGTTYLDMFDPRSHCLFRRGDLARAFDDWEAIEARVDDYPAPDGRIKRFETLIAKRPTA